MDVGDWYKIRFDEAGVYRSAQPREAEAWADQFAWDDISRVCLEVEEFLGTEGLYIFTRTRSESYAIPMQAEGGPELLQELVRRNLFDGELANAAAEAESGVFCWPETE